MASTAKYILGFLFAIGYNHPKESSKHTAPMPDCPPDVYKCKDNCEKNKWNILGLNDRLYWFRRFWTFLPAVLPGEIAKNGKKLRKITRQLWTVGAQL